MDESITLRDNGTPLQINTPYGPVSIQGLAGLIKLCNQLQTMRAVKGMNRPRGLVFSSSSDVPSLARPNQSGWVMRNARATAQLCDRCDSRGVHHMNHDNTWLCDSCEVARLQEMLNKRCEQLGTLMQEVRQKDDCPLFDTAVPEAIEMVKELRAELARARDDFEKLKQTLAGCVVTPNGFVPKDSFLLAREPAPLKLAPMSDEMTRALLEGPKGGDVITLERGPFDYNKTLRPREEEKASPSGKAIAIEHGRRFGKTARMEQLAERGPGLAARYPDATKGGADPEPQTCDVGADWED